MNIGYWSLVHVSWFTTKMIPLNVKPCKPSRESTCAPPNGAVFRKISVGVEQHLGLTWQLFTAKYVSSMIIYMNNTHHTTTYHECHLRIIYPGKPTQTQDIHSFTNQGDGLWAQAPDLLIALNFYCKILWIRVTSFKENDTCQIPTTLTNKNHVIK